MFFFLKQKTAYEMRISDWSSDVCSSDLDREPAAGIGAGEGAHPVGAGHQQRLCLLMPLRPVHRVARHDGKQRLEQHRVAARRQRRHQAGSGLAGRSEERRGGTGCVSTCSDWMSPYQLRTKSLLRYILYHIHFEIYIIILLLVCLVFF